MTSSADAGDYENQPERSIVTFADLATVAAVMDVLIPPDEWPAGWAGGVEKLASAHEVDFLQEYVPLLNSLCRELDLLSHERSAVPFHELDAKERTLVFAALDATASPRIREAIDAAIIVAHQGYYGGTSEPAGWAMVGFQPEPEGAHDPDPETGIAVDALHSGYDVIVIGAGAGGGVAAAELSAAGRRVLLIERSRPMRDRELRGNHLQGKRMELYDMTAGPGAHSPRVLEHADGTTQILRGDRDGAAYGLVAMTLGGGTRVWQGMSWRFLDEDFAMASVYGVPEDSTLADWPFGYDELAPYYDRVEWELGVSGSGAGPIGARNRRTRDYPMPPLPSNRVGKELGAAADRMGWSYGPIPFAINSVPRDGRPACVRCAQCVGHACPVEAKNGTHNTFIPRAIATGNCDLLLSAQALAIEHDGRGTATGVTFVVDTPAGPLERTVHARKVVVCAGAIETPRLILASGLGNDWVGRNHHSHGIAAAVATTAPVVKSYVGPGHSVASLDWVHRNGEAWGGGVVFDFPPMYPLAMAVSGRSAAPSAWGSAHKEWMRASRPPLGTLSMVQEVPHVANRVTLDPRVTDRWGMPVTRLRAEPHPASREASDYMADKCYEWVEAAGGRGIGRVSVPGGVPGAEHSAGTARLAADPANGACDERGKLFGTANVYVADASLHPTNGGFNPGLTAMANSMRVAELLSREN